MPNGRYPHAVWDPGVNAGYAAGRTPVSAVVCHYSVGRDSRPVGRRGYFQFLVSRDGTVTQFAETDAVCWHAGSPWNARGPGVEVEFLPGHDDELWTPEQEAATGALCDWLQSEWQVMASFYDGPRIGEFRGFITHRSLIQTGDAHSDWWPHLPTAVSPPAPIPAPAVPVFALSGDAAMSFAASIIPNVVYEVFSIDDAGQVVQRYYPRANPDEHAIVATDAAPGGDVQAIRQTSASGGAGRCDVWYDKADGTRGHAFQHGSGDWAWHADSLVW